MHIYIYVCVYVPAHYIVYIVNVTCVNYSHTNYNHNNQPCVCCLESARPDSIHKPVNLIITRLSLSKVS